MTIDYGIVRMIKLRRVVGERGSGNTPFLVSVSRFDLQGLGQG